MPYSHGFLSTIIYSLVIVGLLMLIPYFRNRKEVAWWLGAAIFSHWLLDLLSHRPDLPVYGDSMKIGMGLWNHPTWAAIIEVGLFLGGAIWYAIKVKGFRPLATWVFWGFVSLSVIVSTFRSAAMTPANAQGIALSAMFFYVVATLIIYYVERNEKKS